MTHNKPRREFIKRSIKLGAVVGLQSSIGILGYGCSRSREFDTIIKNSEIFDGTGGSSIISDIGIIGDKIIEIGDLSGYTSPNIIDASNLITTPGFIDVHSHSDLRRNPGSESKIKQGVTFDITGPDGGSAFPRSSPNESIDESNQITLANTTSYDKWKSDNVDLAMNVGSYVGHGTVRRLVLGDSPAKPNSTQLGLMKDLVRQAMEEGAMGLSSGLEYHPAGFAETDEVVELAKIAAEYGGVYTTHIRSEDLKVEESIIEAIEICRRSGATLILTHLKIAGKPNWHKIDSVINIIEEGRKEGLEIYCDRYPYLAWSSGLALFYPAWAKADGNLRNYLKDSSQRKKMKAETLEIVRQNGGWESVMISGGVSDQSYVGKFIDKLSSDKNQDPYEFASDILQEGYVGVIGFGMEDKNTERILSLPYCMIASDGSALQEKEGPGGHPRSFGTFPKAITEYVIKRKVIEMSDMIRKITSLPAQVIGIKNRGKIEKNYYADLTIFNPNELKENATYLEPSKFSSGIEHLFVNGKKVISNRNITSNRPGKVISLNDI